MVPKIMAVVYQVVAFLQLCAFVASSATSEEFKCFIVPPSKLAPNECTTSFTYIGENGETREYNRCVTHKEAPPFTQPEDDFDPDELWCPFLIFDIYDFNDDSINVQWGKCECVGVSPPPTTLAPTNSPTPFPTPVPTNAPTETDPPTPLANKCRLRAVQDPILLNSWHPEFNHGKEGADCEFPFEYNFFLRYDCVERVPDATDGRQFGWCFSNISKQEYGTCSCEGVQTPAPTKAPTISPTPEVIIPTTASPTSAPIIRVPTAAPTTAEPTPPPTEKPTSSPTVNPTPAPTVSPTQPLYATVESSVTMEVINIVDEESLKHRFRCFMTFVFSQMMYENRTWIEDLPLSDEYASDLIPFVNVSECVDHPDFSNGQVYGCNVLFRVHTSSIPIVDSVMPTSSPTSLNENVLVPTIAPSTFRNVSSNEPVTVIEFLTDVYANFESPLFQYTLGGSTKVREQLGYIVLPVEPSQKAPENERIRFCQNVKLLRPVANPPPSTNESVTPTVSPEPASQAPGEDDSTTLLTGILVPTLLVVSLCLYYVWRQRGYALCCGNEQTEEKGIEKVNGGNSPAGFLSKLYNQNRSSSGTSIPASSESSLQVGNAGSLEEHVTALSTQFKELQIELSKLRLLSVIGHGATGRIFKAEYSGSSVAVKELFTEHMLPGEGKKASEEMFNDEEWRKIWKEVKHLRLLRHPQIIQLYGCTLAPSNDTGTWRFLVVMELAKCSLLEFLNDSPKAREMKELRTLIGKVVLARQICAGCAYIHDNKMIHFDIKPANILLDMAGNAKICDLGIAKLTKGANNRIEETGSGLGGTPPYMAPELLRGDNEEISTKVDVYSFGIVLWQIFHKRSPHPSEWTVAKLFHEVMVNDYRPALVIKEDKEEEEEDKDKKEEEGEAKVGKDKKDIGVDSELAGLIRECWHKDHKERPNFRTVIEALDEYKFKLGQKEIEGSEFDLNETVEVWSPVEREYVLGFIISKNLVPRHQVLNEIWLQEDNGAEKVKDREFVYVFEVQEQDTDLKRENVLFSDLIKYNPELSRMNVPTQFQSVSRIAMAHAGKSGRDNLTSDSDSETNQGPNLKLPIANVDSSHPETGTSGTTSTVSKNPKTFMLKDGEIDLQGFKFTEDGFEASEVAGNSLASNNVSMPKKSLLKYHLLGKGACGQVHAAIHLPTFDIVAVKEINFSERSARHQAVRELKVLWNSLRRVPATDSLESPEFGKSGFCPSIVAMYDAYLDSEKQCVCLVMEFMNGGSLQDSIDQQVVPSPVDETKQLDMVFGICNESVLARIAFDILSALKFIHDMKLIHLDIKPANILLNIHGEAKLADFGLAKQLENDMQANTFVGTMKYMSPERLKGEKYSYASDIWSLALTLMTCTLGRYPISIKSVSKSADDEIEKADGNAGEHSNKKEPEQKQDLAGSSVYWSLLEIFRKGGIPKLPKKVVLGQVPSKVDSDKVQSSEEPSVHEFSDDYIDFLDKGLKCDPKDRPSATELLSHPWIVKNSKKLETRTVSELPPAVMQANRSTVSAILKRASTISNVLYSVEKKANGQETKIFEEEKLSHLAEQLHLPVEVVQSELIDILSPNNN